MDYKVQGFVRLEKGRAGFSWRHNTTLVGTRNRTPGSAVTCFVPRGPSLAVTTRIQAAHSPVSTPPHNCGALGGCGGIRNCRPQVSTPNHGNQTEAGDLSKHTKG